MGTDWKWGAAVSRARRDQPQQHGNDQCRKMSWRVRQNMLLRLVSDTAALRTLFILASGF
jgi:hypothetical protein